MVTDHAHTCARIHPHAGNHLCHCGHQFDENGPCVRIGNHPYQGDRP